jgi:hypothetical protein
MPGIRKQNVERLLAQDLRLAANARKDAAAQTVNATLLWSAMAARIASGLLAGIANSLAAQKPRRRR